MKSSPAMLNLLLQERTYYSLLKETVFKNDIFGKFNKTSLFFQLHSTATPIILFCGAFLLSLNEYFGDSIQCLQSTSDLDVKLIERYCLYEGNFVYYNDHQTDQIVYPGVHSSTKEDNKKIQIKYYQWVYFILIIQGILFYLPKYIWETNEGKKQQQLCEKINREPINQLASKDRTKLLQEIFDAFILGHHSLSLFIYCKLFCLIHLLTEIWLINIFLNGQFIKLGYNWLNYNNQQLDPRNDPLIQIFPRLTKCNFHKFGFSGEIELHDSLCLLSLNIVNEKIYLVLWFWFCFLILFTIINITIRTIYFSIPSLRFNYLLIHAPRLKKKLVFTFSRFSALFFMTNLLINNMKPTEFADLMEMLYETHFKLTEFEFNLKDEF